MPSTKIVIDKGDDIMVTCRYNGDCDASLYKKGDRLNPVKQLKRSKMKQSNIIKSIKELTWKSQNFQKAYGGIYVCELTDCTESANNGKESFEIQVKGKLLKLNVRLYWACTVCVMHAGICVYSYSYMSLYICIIFNLLHLVAIFQKKSWLFSRCQNYMC